MNNISYESLERINLDRPVPRVQYISSLCINKIVLDIGCFDETAINAKKNDEWLHGQIAINAKYTYGIDNSLKIPAEGILTSSKSKISRGDAFDLPADIDAHKIQIVVCGELIEHLENPIFFLRSIRERYPHATFIVSTPNGCSFANGLMGTFGMEVQHMDHLCNFTYKTLNTLFSRAGSAHFRILPYQFYASEMIYSSTGLKKILAILVQSFIRFYEYLFPLRSFGYIVIAND